jgi:hypothetical protein
MVKKTYNVILNSNNALNASTGLSNFLNYYIDWTAVLPNSNKNYLLTWTYMGSNNYINGYDFPIVSINFNTSNYINGTQGAITTQIIGRLKQNLINGTTFQGYFDASKYDNPPTMVLGRPNNNTITVSLNSNQDGQPYYDNYFTPAGTGTATQSGNVLTIASSTTGTIAIGTVITISGVARTVVAFGSGSGSTGTYWVNISATIGVATAYTFPASALGNIPAPYLLTLCFEELNE